VDAASYLTALAGSDQRGCPKVIALFAGLIVPDPGVFFNLRRADKKIPSSMDDGMEGVLCPQGDSNPCRRLERPVS
jgi:hypothetical protein